LSEFWPKSVIYLQFKQAECIYSITRAKSKCIAFLPRPMLELPLEILQNKKTAEGSKRMLNLVEFCERMVKKENLKWNYVMGFT